MQLEIGGQQIDQHYSDWLHMYGEIFRTGEASNAYRRLVDFEDYAPTGYIKRFYVPLIFFFNRNPGLALPLDDGRPKRAPCRASRRWLDPDGEISRCGDPLKPFLPSQSSSCGGNNGRDWAIRTGTPESASHRLHGGRSRPERAGG